jgi:hypothetical protein
MAFYIPMGTSKGCFDLKFGKIRSSRTCLCTPSTWRGALKREALGKQNFELVKGWVNEKNLTRWLGDKNCIVISKTWLNQISKTKKQCQQSYVNTIYPICQEANGVSK